METLIVIIIGAILCGVIIFGLGGAILFDNLKGLIVALVGCLMLAGFLNEFTQFTPTTPINTITNCATITISPTTD